MLSRLALLRWLTGAADDDDGRDIPAHHHGPVYRFNPLRLAQAADERITAQLDKRAQHNALVALNQADQLDAITALLEDVRNLLNQMADRIATL